MSHPADDGEVGWIHTDCFNSSPIIDVVDSISYSEKDQQDVKTNHHDKEQKYLNYKSLKYVCLNILENTSKYSKRIILTLYYTNICNESIFGLFFLIWYPNLWFVLC